MSISDISESFTAGHKTLCEQQQPNLAVVHSSTIRKDLFLKYLNYGLF